MKLIDPLLITELINRGQVENPGEASPDNQLMDQA